MTARACHLVWWCVGRLGPGDFFGETGLLEGRDSRQASVVCRSGVEVMAMEREVFKQVAGAGAGASGNKLADSMKEKADARQRARLTKVFEMMNVAAQNRRTYAKGSVVFRQGETADHFYIVNSGTLDVSITTPDGRAVRVKRLSPGDHFGYDALLAETHDTTVTCLTDVEVRTSACNKILSRMHTCRERVLVLPTSCMHAHAHCEYLY